MPVRRAACSLRIPPAPALPPPRCLLLPARPPSSIPTTHNPPAPAATRLFSSTPPRPRDEHIDNARNHYEALNLHPGATPVEIKKSFYALSKAYHPDHNRTDPHSSARRFMRISEAYSVLSIPAKRAAYDRQHSFPHPSASHSHPHLHPHSHAHGGGATTTTAKSPSYSSTGPAGGRPASGLSRRRGVFHGPPPSFFRSGGWGAQAAKRRQAHEESTGSSSHLHHPSSSSPHHHHNHPSSSSNSPFSSADIGRGTAGGGGGGGGIGGMGPGQAPFARGSEVPHFDRASHERTGRRSDRRRAARRAATDDIEPERGMAGMFFVIGGVLALSILGPLVISRLWRGGGTGASDRQQERKRKSIAS
ncbi:hypothetical protein AAE478_006559 [Parahypoxylon ruwenzoriense]